MKCSSGFFASSRTLFPKVMKSTWASGAYLFAFGGESVAELPRAQIRHSIMDTSRRIRVTPGRQRDRCLLCGPDARRRLH